MKLITDSKTRGLFPGHCFGMRVAMMGVMVLTLIGDGLLLLVAGSVIYLCLFVM